MTRAMFVPLRRIVVLAALILTPGVVSAQGTGVVTGTVSDQTGAVLPGVTVERQTRRCAELHRDRHGQPAPIASRTCRRDRRSSRSA